MTPEERRHRRAQIERRARLHANARRLQELRDGMVAGWEEEDEEEEDPVDLVDLLAMGFLILGPESSDG